MRTVLVVMAAVLAVGCSKARTESIALVNQGIRAYQANELEEAITLFSGAAARDPKNAQAHFQLGMIYLYDKKGADDAEQKRFLEAAEAELATARKLDPRDPDILFQLGRLSLLRNDVDAALARFQEVIQLAPEHAAALYWAGHALEKKGKLVEADDMYRRSIAADPTYARSFSALGMMYLNQRAEAAAKAVLAEGARINPEDPAVHHNLGLVHLTLGEVDEAVQEITRSLELDPEDATAAFNLANALVRKQRYKEASFYLKKFIVNPAVQGSDMIEPANLLLNTLQVVITEQAAMANP